MYICTSSTTYILNLVSNLFEAAARTEFFFVEKKGKKIDFFLSFFLKKNEDRFPFNRRCNERTEIPKITCTAVLQILVL